MYSETKPSSYLQSLNCEELCYNIIEIEFIFVLYYSAKHSISTMSHEGKKICQVGQLYSDKNGPKLQVDELWQKWRSLKRNKDQRLLIYCEESESEGDGHEETTQQ